MGGADLGAEGDHGVGGRAVGDGWNGRVFAPGAQARDGEFEGAGAGDDFVWRGVDDGDKAGVDARGVEGNIGREGGEGEL